MLLVNVVVYDVRQWQITLLAEILIHRPPSSVTLSAELKELYVHKTNGGFTQWLLWKMAAPKAYFFRTECGGWWMLGDGSFWARSFLDRRDFQLILISSHPHRMKILTLMSPLRVTSGLSIIHGQRRRAATGIFGCVVQIERDIKTWCQWSLFNFFQYISDDLFLFCDWIDGKLWKWKLTADI